MRVASLGLHPWSRTAWKVPPVPSTHPTDGKQGGAARTRSIKIHCQADEIQRQSSTGCEKLLKSFFGWESSPARKGWAGSKSPTTGAEGGSQGSLGSGPDKQLGWGRRRVSSRPSRSGWPPYLYCLDPAMKIRSEKVGLNSWLFSPLKCRKRGWGSRKERERAGIQHLGERHFAGLLLLARLPPPEDGLTPPSQLQGQEQGCASNLGSHAGPAHTIHGRSVRFCRKHSTRGLKPRNSSINRHYSLCVWPVLCHSLHFNLHPFISCQRPARRQRQGDGCVYVGNSIPSCGSLQALSQESSRAEGRCWGKRGLLALPTLLGVSSSRGHFKVLRMEAERTRPRPAAPRLAPWAEGRHSCSFFEGDGGGGWVCFPEVGGGEVLKAPGGFSGPSHLGPSRDAQAAQGHSRRLPVGLPDRPAASPGPRSPRVPASWPPSPAPPAASPFLCFIPRTGPAPTSH